MAIHKSVIKRDRQSKKRRMRNVSIKSQVKTSIKKFLTTVKNENSEEAGVLLKNTVSKINKAASKGIIPRNTASRRVSRLTKKVNLLLT